MGDMEKDFSGLYALTDRPIRSTGSASTPLVPWLRKSCEHPALRHKGARSGACLCTGRPTRSGLRGHRVSGPPSPVISPAKFEVSPRTFLTCCCLELDSPNGGGRRALADRVLFCRFCGGG